ncbi:MAG: ParB N-terminal domain-containing protein [Spirochaetales bacterium]
MQLPVDEIIIRKRIRRELGDLSALKDSMKRYGLMNPVVINRANELIAGHRRLEAARELGWHAISVRVVDQADAADILEMEIEENTHRKPLSTDELGEAYKRLDYLRNPGRIRRFLDWIKRLFRRLFRRKRE